MKGGPHKSMGHLFTSSFSVCMVKWFSFFRATRRDTCGILVNLEIHVYRETSIVKQRTIGLISSLGLGIGCRFGLLKCFRWMKINKSGMEDYKE